MKLHADRHDDLNAITAYGEGWVEVSGIRHEGALLIRPEGPVLPWDVAGFEALTPDILLALGWLDAIGASDIRTISIDPRPNIDQHHILSGKRPCIMAIVQSTGVSATSNNWTIRMASIAVPK